MSQMEPKSTEAFIQLSKNVLNKKRFGLISSYSNTHVPWLHLCYVAINNPLLTLMTTFTTNSLTCFQTGKTSHTQTHTDSSSFHLRHKQTDEPKHARTNIVEVPSNEAVTKIAIQFTTVALTGNQKSHNQKQSESTTACLTAVGTQPITFAVHRWHTFLLLLVSCIDLCVSFRLSDSLLTCKRCVSVCIHEK